MIMGFCWDKQVYLGIMVFTSPSIGTVYMRKLGISWDGKLKSPRTRGHRRHQILGRLATAWRVWIRIVVTPPALKLNRLLTSHILWKRRLSYRSIWRYLDSTLRSRSSCFDFTIQDSPNHIIGSLSNQTCSWKTMKIWNRIHPRKTPPPGLRRGIVGVISSELVDTQKQDNQIWFAIHFYNEYDCFHSGNSLESSGTEASRYASIPLAEHLSGTSIKLIIPADML
jgi:hypothetical protein